MYLTELGEQEIKYEKKCYCLFRMERNMVFKQKIQGKYFC